VMKRYQTADSYGTDNRLLDEGRKHSTQVL
jgi:hypothetical protein